MQRRSNFSEKGVFSFVMLFFSVGCLGIAMLSGAKLVYDILDFGLVNSLDGLGIKSIVTGLAYILGWITAMLAIRVYANQYLPLVINLFVWASLIGICILYVLIMQRLYHQKYDLSHFIAYVGIMASAILGMIGLHLILEGHNPRPLAIPILAVSFFHLCRIVFRYVFAPLPVFFSQYPQGFYLTCDLVFFMGMLAFGVLMLARIGILEPMRRRITNFFDQKSQAVRI
jgi:hypothetical protein